MAQNTGDHFKIIWYALKGLNYLEVTCMLFWIKWRLIYSKIQRNETENGSFKIKDPPTEAFQLKALVLHQSKCISKAGPSSLGRIVWAEYKDKVTDVSDSHRNIGTSNNSKPRLPNVMICVSKLQKDYLLKYE